MAEYLDYNGLSTALKAVKTYVDNKANSGGE